MPSDKRQVLECLYKSTPIDIFEQLGFTGIPGKKKAEIAAFQSRKGSVKVEESMSPAVRQIVSVTLSSNDSALAVLGYKTLKLIAQELVNSGRKSITIDWTLRGMVRAQMGVHQADTVELRLCRVYLINTQPQWKLVLLMSDLWHVLNSHIKSIYSTLILCPGPQKISCRMKILETQT